MVSISLNLPTEIVLKIEKLAFERHISKSEAARYVLKLESFKKPSSINPDLTENPDQEE